jgi:hypothetical protein
MPMLVSTPAAARDTTGVGAIDGVVVKTAGQPAEGLRVFTGLLRGMVQRACADDAGHPRTATGARPS